MSKVKWERPEYFRSAEEHLWTYADLEADGKETGNDHTESLKLDVRKASPGMSFLISAATFGW